MIWKTLQKLAMKHIKKKNLRMTGCVFSYQWLFDVSKDSEEVPLTKAIRESITVNILDPTVRPCVLVIGPSQYSC